MVSNNSNENNNNEDTLFKTLWQMQEIQLQNARDTIIRPNIMEHADQ